jgi:type I restriction enzyme S subunit
MGKTKVSPKSELIEAPRKLPQGWEWVCLDQAFEIRRGSLIPSNFPDEMFTLYSIPAYDIGQKPDVISGGQIRSSKTIVKKGDILFSKLNPRIPRVWIVGDNLGKRRVASTEFLPLVIRDVDSGEPFFLHIFARYLLLSNSVRAQITRDVQGATGSRQRIRPQVLKQAVMPRPISLETQRTIVDRIESLLAEIREARMYLHEMLRDGELLLASAYEEVFNRVSEFARFVPLEELATAENGRAVGSGDSDVRVFKTRHVYPHSLRQDQPFFAKSEQTEKLPDDRFLQAGDVLMANIAEGTLGRVTFVEKAESDWTVDTQVMILRSKDQDNVLHGKWLYYYLWSSRGQREILSRRSGIAFADKRGQTHIYPKNVREIPILVTDINTQRREVEFLDSVLSKSLDLQRKIEKNKELLEQLEQSILESAFRGEFS